MKKIILSCLIVLSFSIPSLCQTVNDLNQVLDSLKSQKKLILNELDRINQKILKVNWDIVKAYEQKKLQDGLEIYVKYHAYLYEGRSTGSTILDTIPANTALLSYEFKNNYYLVHYDKLVGFVFSLDVESAEKHAQKIKQVKNTKEQQYKREQQQKLAREKRKQELINKYGQTIGTKISSGHFWIGMTDEMAKASLGIPNDVNRTVGSWGVHEQWIYENRDIILYFENGILKSYQN
jgi:hypothetical protein